jgi:galactokinase
MNIHELIKTIDSECSTTIFSELYGESEAGNAGQRYQKLITETRAIGEHFSATEDLRIFSAPGRTELAGNHTDHNHGKVLAASIQLDNTAIVQKRNDNMVFFRSTGFPDVKVTLTDKNGNPDLQPKPEEKGTTEALVRGIAAELCRRGCGIGGFSANADSTVLAGSGLSSSAALETLLGRIFDSLYGGGKRGPLEIAQIGQIAENTYFGKPCGLMDQAACAAGGAVAINFANAACPEIKRINFDPAAAGFSLCVVNTGGSHADLTADYASIPEEMKKTAAFFGAAALGELKKDLIISRAADLRREVGDRALLRSLHFFDENARVDAMTLCLMEMDTAVSGTAQERTFLKYLELVNESGDSSWRLLQNIYSPIRPAIQSIGVALALTKDFFRAQKLPGACRVHGGGFAGTIQAYIPSDAINAYRSYIEAVFGAGSVTILRIRPVGAVEIQMA